MKIILHIGTEKTGTTSIQNFIALNNSLLRENGFYTLYDFVIPKSVNNLELVLAVSKHLGDDILRLRHLPAVEYRNFIKESLHRIISEAISNKCNHLICTSEHLSSRLINIDDIKALKDLFPSSCNFQIIVYLRKQNELFLGMQSESIKSGRPIDVYAPNIPTETDKPYGLLFFDYEKMLEMWSNVFGKEAIIVRPHEKEQLENKDVIFDFLKVLKLEHIKDKMKTAGNYNKRLSPEILFYLFKMNSYLFNGTHRNQIIKILKQVDEFESGIFCTNAELEKFYNYFKESNNRVAMSYLGNNELFIADVEKYREFDESRYYKEDIGAKITCLYLDRSAKLAQQAKNKDALLQHIEQQLRDKEAIIKNKDNQLQQKEEQLQNKEAQIGQINRQLQATVNSYSFRVGKVIIWPLSVLKKIFLKLT